MLVKLIIEDKVYMQTQKMANAIVSLAKSKYESQNVNAIVALKKGDIIVLRKDVFDDIVSLDEAVKEGKQAGYTCYYNKAKGGN